MPVPLNKTQQQLLEILKDRSNSYTLDQLATMLSLANKSSVHYNIKELLKKGYLKVNPSNSSDYIVLDSRDDGMFYLPLYSSAQCGPDGRLVYDDEATEIPIPSRLFTFDVAHAIAIRTEGDSMEPRIPGGAVAIVNRQENQYVPNQPFLTIVNNTPLIKKLFDPGNKDPNFILSSYNPDYPPFVSAKKDTIIIGRVRGIINNL
ncbi:MAG: hypothetical protein OHK0017_13420 [Patescibacteria group bacterium]